METPRLNPYAPARRPVVAAWREGSLLVMGRKGARLPDRCICCNQPTTYRWSTHIFWNPVASRLMLFIWPIVLMLTRGIKLDLPLCRVHEGKRRLGLLIAAALTLVGGALLAADWFRHSGAPLFVPFFVVGLALTGGGLIYLLAGANPLNVVEINDDYVWLDKADSAFLKALEADLEALTPKSPKIEPPAAVVQSAPATTTTTPAATATATVVHPPTEEPPAAGPKPKLHPLLDRYAAPLSGVAAPPLPGPVAPRVLEGVWRREGLLIIRTGAIMPSRCVVCNCSTGNRWRKTFSWVPPAYRSPFLRHFATRETAEISIPLCEEHDGERMVKTRNSWLLAIGGIALIFVSIAAMLNGAAGVGQLLIGIGFITLVIAAFLSGSANPLQMARVTSQYAFLKKAGDAYLRSLPPAPPNVGWHSG